MAGIPTWCQHVGRLCNDETWSDCLEETLNLTNSVNTAFLQIDITVMSVPDYPEITLPASPTVKEDNTISIRGLGMYDADVSRPGDEDLSFTVWLEAVAGRLSLNGSTVRPFRSLVHFDSFLLDLSGTVVSA